MNPATCFIVDICKMQWFLYYVQSAQPVPSNEVQASCMTGNTILMTYQPTGAYIWVHETCHQDVKITITICLILIFLKGNGTVASVFV